MNSDSRRLGCRGPWGEVVDAIAELTVVPSFSRLGYAWRRRLFAWSEPAPGSMAGRTVLVTGPTSGIGRASVEAFAAGGARVVLVGRSPERLAALRDDLVGRHGDDRFPIVVADMGSLGSVRAGVAAILAGEPRLDVVVDNAGAIYPVRTMGPDGIEATFALLTVAPFVLVGGLLRLLRQDGGGRIVAVTSGGQYTQPLDLDDLQGARRPYSGPRSYARAKRAQVALVREWARRLRGSGVVANATHPGWADTPGLAETLPAFYDRMRPLLRTPVEGADTAVWLASAPEAGTVSGRLFLDRRPRPFDRLPGTRLNAAERRRLWDEVVALSGQPDPLPDE